MNPKENKEYYISSECYGHGDRQKCTDNPDDQNDHLCAGFGGVALEEEHDGFISVNSDCSECEDAGLHTQILKYHYSQS